MSVQHKQDSIRNLRLERLGIQPPADWAGEESGSRPFVFRGDLRRN
jgi:hypothetical protein